MAVEEWTPSVTLLLWKKSQKVDNSCSVIMSVNNSLVCWGLEEYGTEEQKEILCLA